MKKDAVFFKFVLINCFTSSSLILPVRIVWLLHYLITIDEISTLKVILSLTISFFEIPTGIVADLMSRRMSMAISAFLFSLHAVFYCLLPNFYGFALTQVLLGLSASFMSGADSSYFHSYLNEKTQENSFAYVDLSSKIGLIGKIVSACYALVSSILFNYEPRIVFGLSFVMGLIAATIILTLPKEQRETIRFKDIKIKHFIEMPIKTWQVIIGNRNIINIILSTAFIYSFL